MEAVTRTIYGSALQTAQLIGVPYKIHTNSTLNEYFNINPTDTLPDGKYPTTGYYCIGTGGVKLVTGANDVIYEQQQQHRSTDASCYKHIPFVLRSLNNDLSPTERVKYALRKVEVYKGVQYIAYYLKRIDLSLVKVKLENISIVNGVKTITPYVPNNTNLAPIPPLISNNSTNVLSGDYITCSAILNLSFSETECTELSDAFEIIYGSSATAVISEIGICSGIDKMVTLSDTGANFKEAVCVQIATFVNTFYAIKYTPSGINLEYDFGVAEPLFNII